MRTLALAVLALSASQPHVLARVETGAGPGGATAAFGAVWVANDRAGTIARIDPRTNRVTRLSACGRESSRSRTGSTCSGS